MKAGCIILSVTIFLAIMAVCIMVKFATDITVDERKRVFGSPGVYLLPRSMGVITMSDTDSDNMSMAKRFPYVAAITRNSSTIWSFSCFASVVLLNWVVTAAHCRRPGALHRVLLYQDFARNYSQTYPVLYWRLHEKFNSTDSFSRYDIAVAKINVETYPFTHRASVFDPREAKYFEAAIWKTVSSMSRKLYLTNDFGKISVTTTDFEKCSESYGLIEDISLICIDLSPHMDCFVHDFGPLYTGDKIVGILAVKPRDCDMKLAIFTNISFYTNWILKSTTVTTYY